MSLNKENKKNGIWAWVGAIYDYTYYSGPALLIFFIKEKSVIESFNILLIRNLFI